MDHFEDQERNNNNPVISFYCSVNGVLPVTYQVVKSDTVWGRSTYEWSGWLDSGTETGGQENWSAPYTRTPYGYTTVQYTHSTYSIRAFSWTWDPESGIKLIFRNVPIFISVCDSVTCHGKACSDDWRTALIWWALCAVHWAWRDRAHLPIILTYTHCTAAVLCCIDTAVDMNEECKERIKNQAIDVTNNFPR